MVINNFYLGEIESATCCAFFISKSGESSTKAEHIPQWVGNLLALFVLMVGIEPTSSNLLLIEHLTFIH